MRAGRLLAPRVTPTSAAVVWRAKPYVAPKSSSSESVPVLLNPQVDAIKKTIPAARIVPPIGKKTKLKKRISRMPSCHRADNFGTYTENQHTIRTLRMEWDLAFASSSSSDSAMSDFSTRMPSDSESDASSQRHLGPGYYDTCESAKPAVKAFRWSTAPRFPRAKKQRAGTSELTGTVEEKKRIRGGVIDPVRKRRAIKTECRRRMECTANMPFRTRVQTDKIISFIFRPLPLPVRRMFPAPGPAPDALGPGHYDAPKMQALPGAVAWKPPTRRSKVPRRYRHPTPGPGTYTLEEIAKRIPCFKYRPVLRAFRRKVFRQAGPHTSFMPAAFGSSARACSLGKRWKQEKRVTRPGPASYDPRENVVRPNVRTMVMRHPTRGPRLTTDHRDFGGHKDSLLRQHRDGAPIYRPKSAPPRPTTKKPDRWRFYDVARNEHPEGVGSFSRRVPKNKWATYARSVAKLEAHLEASYGRFARRSYSLPPPDTMQKRAPAYSFPRKEREPEPLDIDHDELILNPHRPGDEPPSCFVQFDLQQPKVSEAMHDDPDEGNVLLLEPQKPCKKIPFFHMAKQVSFMDTQAEHDEEVLLLSPKFALTERRSRAYDFSKNVGKPNVDYRLIDEPVDDSVLLLYWSD
eukprot:GEMP01024101.1.p1 GENE.GEMP01024101.1~~GEMP01024101.1.p1  ORF type:complete len:631 (+),score=171.11 GEMP01024101.1:535-2427(+)